ncbi:MAG: glucose 1-dehydrogenase [Chloroflexi bacterium]|nr:glucose 1-dehydrogenase [Chloroflexota bacterium]
MGRLDGKVALITGGARGQGAEEGRLFAAEGARVVLTDVRDEEGEAAARRIGEAAIYLHHDVRDEDEWEGVVQRVVDRHGRVDVLVNNAGIYRRRDLLDLPLAEYMQIIEINQVGVFLGLKVVARAMRDGGGGAIVNISSTAGMRGAAGAIAYGASKWAVRGMTKAAARELGPLGIRVNSIHPGPIDTEMLVDGGIADRRAELAAAAPLRRIGEAADVARLALFLASDESAHCTGAEFVIDGGSLA